MLLHGWLRCSKSLSLAVVLLYPLRHRNTFKVVFVLLPQPEKGVFHVSTHRCSGHWSKPKRQLKWQTNCEFLRGEQRNDSCSVIVGSVGFISPWSSTCSGADCVRPPAWELAPPSLRPQFSAGKWRTAPSGLGMSWERWDLVFWGLVHAWQ